MKMQELKEAVGVESRTTILNPTYIKEKMKGGASSASEFAEVITNTYGWNVMKPAAIDKELWDNIYNVYVKDELNLGVKQYFEQQNPCRFGRDDCRHARKRPVRDCGKQVKNR